MRGPTITLPPTGCSSDHQVHQPDAVSPFPWFSLDENCLALKESSPLTISLPSSSSSKRQPPTTSAACIAYMRSTVVLSEFVYWFACYVWACLLGGGGGPSSSSSSSSRVNDCTIKPSHQHPNKWTNLYNHHHSFSWSCFLLLSLNPAILWLDHVHFQYNGFL